MNYKNIFISVGMAGSSKGSAFEQWELEAKTRPRFGRNWWYWLPNLKSNNGRFHKHENTDITLHWLCFWISFTVFSWGRKKV